MKGFFDEMHVSAGLMAYPEDDLDRMDGLVNQSVRIGWPAVLTSRNKAISVSGGSIDGLRCLS